MSRTCATIVDCEDRGTVQKSFWVSLRKQAMGGVCAAHASHCNPQQKGRWSSWSAYQHDAAVATTDGRLVEQSVVDRTAEQGQ